MAPTRLDRTPETSKLSSRLQALISNLIYEIFVYICVVITAVFFLSVITTMLHILVNLRGTCIEFLGGLLLTLVGVACWLCASLVFEED
jgi:hypothetical protein